MLILAIDTTGFSASIALVKNGKEVLFNKIHSGFIPKKNWWDFPYLLPAHHQKFLINNLEKTLKEKKISWKDIDAIAVSANSGIYTCILVGVSIAKILANCYKKSLIEVDHILAHIYSAWLERNFVDFRFPILVFSASGSHSDFSLLKNKKSCEIIYNTVSRQMKRKVRVFVGIGRVFQTIGKSLGTVKSTDKTTSIKKTIEAMNKGNPFKFNFTKYYKGKLQDLNFFDFMNSINKFIKKKKQLSSELINDIAASFQESITEILVDKIIKLAGIKKAKEIHIVGGISENKYLEKKLKDRIKKEKLPFILRYPVKKKYRLDNAAMIGALAYYQEKYNIKFINFKPKITY